MARLGRSYPVNRVFAPHKGSGGPVFDAVGAGYNTLSPNISISWSHTAMAGAYSVVSFIVNATNGFPASYTPTVTFGSTSLSQLGYATDGSSFPGTYLFFYGGGGVAGGSQTVTVNNGSGTGRYIFGNSITVTGVTSAGTPTTVNDGGTSGTSLSQTVTCPANSIIIQSFEDSANSGIASYSGGTGQYICAPPGYGGVLTISTATANTTFTATDSVTTPWAGMSVVLS